MKNDYVVCFGGFKKPTKTWDCVVDSMISVLSCNFGRVQKGLGGGNGKGVFAFACKCIVSPCGRTGNGIVTQMRRVASQRYRIGIPVATQMSFLFARVKFGC